MMRTACDDGRSMTAIVGVAPNNNLQVLSRCTCGMRTRGFSQVLSSAFLVARSKTLAHRPLLANTYISFISPGNSTPSYSSTARFMSDEVKKAQEAAELAADGSPPTVFDKIVSGEWSSDKLHEDDLCLAFRDITPQAPVHFLVIPKQRDGLTQLSKAREDQKALLGHLMYVAQQIGQQECPDGFRVTINDGKDGAQSVYHLHLHVMGGRQMQWPPG